MQNDMNFYRDPIVVMWKQRSTTIVPHQPANLMRDDVILMAELRQFSEFIVTFTGVYEADDYSESFDTLEECLESKPDKVLYSISGRIKGAPSGVNPWHNLHDAETLAEAKSLRERYAESIEEAA